MRFNILVIAIVFSVCVPDLSAQERLSFAKTPDTWFAPLAGGIGVGGWLIGHRDNALNVADLSTLHTSDIPAFDRWATNYSSSVVATASDIGLASAVALPLVVLSEFRDDIPDLLMIYGETLSLTYGLTEAAKTAGRIRPRAYNTDLSLSERTSSEVRKSFFSGHTSVSMAAGVFTARVYELYRPGSATSKALWIIGPGLGLLTGGLRVFSGNHFPSDVLVGAAVGAIVGYVVPEMHRTKKSYSYGITPSSSGAPMVNVRFVF